MLKKFSQAALMTGAMVLATGTPVMAAAHTEAVAAACAERSNFSAAECSCLGSKASSLNESEVAFMLSLGDGEWNSLQVARDNDTGLIGMAKVNFWLRVNVPLCVITE